MLILTCNNSKVISEDFTTRGSTRGSDAPLGEAAGEEDCFPTGDEFLGETREVDEERDNLGAAEDFPGVLGSLGELPSLPLLSFLFLKQI